MLSKRLINDLSFVLLGLLLAYGYSAHLYDNQFVVLTVSNALTLFIVANYGSDIRSLFLKKIKKENIKNTEISLPPIPVIENDSQKIIQLRKKYNIDNENNSEESMDNNVIPFHRPLNQQEINEIIENKLFRFKPQAITNYSHGNIVDLNYYRLRKNGSWNNPEGA